MAVMVITMISLTACRGKLMHVMTFLTSAKELRNTTKDKMYLHPHH